MISLVAYFEGSTIPIDLDKVDSSFRDKEILRAGMIAELDAINQYEQMAELAKNEEIKKLLLDIAKEEKTHVGEFESMLLKFDKEQSVELDKGEKEVSNLEKGD